MRKKGFKESLIFGAVFYFSTFLAAPLWGDVILNILAVNGTDVTREKEIREHLPKELLPEDIIETGDLEVEYDVDADGYVVTGIIKLAPKESRTLRVRVRDVWQLDQEKIKDIREQIEESVNRLKDTEYYETGLIKKNRLNERLDFIIAEQERFADNVEQRISRHRTYAKEIGKIRNNAVSIKYWRSALPKPTDANIFRLVLYAENLSTDNAVTSEQKHYMPAEVKPEHILDTQGFVVRYDPMKGQSYLFREDTLQPSEVKRYEVSIIDVWKIDQAEVENLRNRARYTFKYLKPTEYLNTAQFLIEGIKEKLEEIEISQAREKNIHDHIQEFRFNMARFGVAQKDVETLEELLEAVREKLVRSKLENILNKMKSLRGVSEIAKAIFQKPIIDRTWKWLLSILIFVGLLTIVTFVVSGKRSGDIKIEKDAAVEDEEKQEVKT